MPIVDIQLVAERNENAERGLSQRLANALGKVFDADPGRVWVRLHILGSDCYAENDVSVGPAELPVFVKVLLASFPQSSVLGEQAEVLAATVAACVGRRPDRVHIEYSAAGAGRMAFGGRLVR